MVEKNCFLEYWVSLLVLLFHIGLKKEKRNKFLCFSRSLYFTILLNFSTACELNDTMAYEYLFSFISNVNLLGPSHPRSIDGRICAEVRTLDFLLLWSLWCLTNFQCSITHISILRFDICYSDPWTCTIQMYYFDFVYFTIKYIGVRIKDRCCCCKTSHTLSAKMERSV